MKTRNILSLALSSLFVLSSCSSDEDNAPLSAGSVDISVSVEGGTRTSPHATDESSLKFDGGDVIRLFNTETGQFADYSYDGTSWTSAAPLIWVKKQLTLDALYPSTTDRSNPYLPADQSTLEQLKSADIMTLSDTQGQFSETGTPVNITMKRMTSRIRVIVKFNAEYDGRNPQVSDFYVSANNNFTSVPSETPSGDAAKENIVDFKPYFDGTAYTVLAGPTSMKSDRLFVRFKVTTSDGDSKTFGISGIPHMNGGTSYTYTISAGTSPVIQGVAIAPWTGN